jgi:hypothetical protein
MLSMAVYDTPLCAACLLLLNVACVHFRRTSFSRPLSSSSCYWSLSMFWRSDLEHRRRMHRCILLNCVWTNGAVLLNFFLILLLFHRVQNSSEAHPASYPMDTRGSFPGGKAAGAWSWPLTFFQCRGQRMCGAIPQFPRVVTGEKKSPTVAHACRKRRLKWVLPQVGGWSTGLETLSL